MATINEEKEIGVLLIDEDMVIEEIQKQCPDIEYSDADVEECIHDIRKHLDSTGVTQVVTSIVDNNVTLLHDRLTGECSNDKYDEYEKVLADITIIAKDIINRPEPKKDNDEE